MKGLLVYVSPEVIELTLVIQNSAVSIVIGNTVDNTEEHTSWLQVYYYYYFMVLLVI